MDGRVGAAAALSESDRQELAVQALARAATVNDLAVQHGTSRKFVYQQMHKAGAVLDDAFLSAAPDQEVLFTVSSARSCRLQATEG
jgi:HJR/Mrr/RecB family endonuclease